jgi:virginiamycin B lyase
MNPLSRQQAALATTCSSHAAGRQMGRRRLTVRRSLELEPLEGRCVPVLTMTGFDLAASASQIGNIVSGPDGNLWFIKSNSHPWVIDRITPTGTLTEFTIPAPNDLSAFIWDLTAGADGNVWFADTLWIGKLTPTGGTSLYSLPEGMAAVKLTFGPDGNIWFVDPFANKIGRMTLDGQATEFTGATNVRFDNFSRVETFIAPGLNGNVWFSEPLALKYGIIDPAGNITEKTLPDPGAILAPWTIGPDGNLWSNNAWNAFLRFSPDGTLTEFPHPTNMGGGAFHVGTDGRMWYVAGSGFGYLNTDGTYQEYWTDPFAFSESGIKGFTTGPNNTLWFTYSGLQTPTSQVVRVDIDLTQPITVTFTSSLTVKPGDSQIIVWANVNLPNLYPSDQAMQPLADWGDGTPLVPGEFGSVTPGVSNPVQVGKMLVGSFHTYIHEGVYQIKFIFDLVARDQLQLPPPEQTNPVVLASVPYSATVAYPAHEKLVMSLYEDLLHREADSAALTGWTAMLDQGTSTLEVARLIESSPEYRTRAVDRLYQALLDRGLDPAGQAAALNFLAVGGTLEQIRTSILASPEYLVGHGHGAVDGFLMALYQDVLGRGIDPAGLQGWQASLAGGMSPITVIGLIAGSGSLGGLFASEPYGGRSPGGARVIGRVLPACQSATTLRSRFP